MKRQYPWIRWRKRTVQANSPGREWYTTKSRSECTSLPARTILGACVVRARVNRCATAHTKIFFSKLSLDPYGSPLQKLRSTGCVTVSKLQTDLSAMARTNDRTYKKQSDNYGISEMIIDKASHKSHKLGLCVRLLLSDTWIGVYSIHIFVKFNKIWT